MSELKFKPGDVVKHKSADLKLTVNFIVNEREKTYNCVWYDPNTEGEYKGFHYEKFYEHVLELHTENS